MLLASSAVSFNSFHVTRSSCYTYHFVFNNYTGRWRTAVYLLRSCFRHLLLLLLDLVPHVSQFVVYISHHVRSIMNIMSLSTWYHTFFSCSKIKPEIRALLYSLMFARAFGIFCCLLQFLTRITYLAVRGVHITSSSRIKSEDGVLLGTLMSARALGIYCCFCLISYHIPHRA